MSAGRPTPPAGVDIELPDAGDKLVRPELLGVGDQLQVGDAGGWRRGGFRVSGRALGWAWRVIRCATSGP